MIIQGRCDCRANSPLRNWANGRVLVKPIGKVWKVWKGLLNKNHLKGELIQEEQAGVVLCEYVRNCKSGWLITVLFV